MIIDEAGNFGVKDENFTEQLLYFAKETLKDDRVLALTYFLWLDPTKSPGNILNSWVDNLTEPELDKHLYDLSQFSLDGSTELPDPDPEPEPEENGISVKVTYEKYS
ncbi:hypothetical protein ACFL03_03045 [Thermodesulfobacteriota bacterium]